VERLVFTAGYPAVGYVQNLDSEVEQLSSILGTQRENAVKVLAAMKQRLEESQKREKLLGEKLIEASVPKLISSAITLNGSKGKAMLYVSLDADMSDELIVSLGEKLVKEEPSIVDVSISPRGNSTRIVCFVGPKALEAGVAADALIRELSKAAGGSGGGKKDFAQGGGPKPVDVEEASEMLTKSISGMIGK